MSNWYLNATHIKGDMVSLDILFTSAPILSNILIISRYNCCLPGLHIVARIKGVRPSEVCS